MHDTQVLQSSKEGRGYTGPSSDRRARIDDPRKGPGESTRHHRPLQLLDDQACLTEAEAQRGERYWKTGKGKRYLRSRNAGLAPWLGNSRKELERH